ncbi:MAG: dephospho-CoA kinase [Bacillota bacterium]
MSLPRVPVIGLTGGIATGKSTVASVLSGLGATVIDCDALAREVTVPGAPAYWAIIREFGAGAAAADGLDRRFLAARVFADPDARARLEALVHPAVIARTGDLVKEAAVRGAAAIVIDAPLLLEAGLEGMCDEVWVVWTDAKTQLERLQARDGLAEAEALRRIEAQWPLSRKLESADRVLDSSGTLESLREQAKAYYQDIMRASET